MCGIAGQVGFQHHNVHDMLSIISERGPDNLSVCELDSPQVVLGHVRLAILDLDERSNQPFWSTCRKFCIVFNGEIYNYLELREVLISEGLCFSTESDTEVLLYWLIRKGKEGLKFIDGMFSFAFYSLNSKELYCARDPLGEKPFFYSLDDKNKCFSFASEIKSLLLVPDIDKDVNPCAISDYIKFLYVPAPNTFYKGISELAPGHDLTLNTCSLKFSIGKFYDLEQEVECLNYSESPYLEYLELFKASMIRRLRSDVPINILLSAGMDSNAIFAIATDVLKAKNISAFTMKYSGSKEANEQDESEVAKCIARSKNIKINVMNFDLNSSWEDAADRVIDLFGQPFGNSTALVSDAIFKGVSQESRVALLGDGGDESCIGYPRYKALPLQSNLYKLPMYAKKSLDSIGQFLIPRISNNALKRRGQKLVSSIYLSPEEAFLDWSSYVPQSKMSFIMGGEVDSSFYQNMTEIFKRNADKDLFKAASLVDLQSFVPFNLMQSADRTSMAHSVEARAPFLSLDLIKFSLSQSPNIKVRRGVTKPLINNSMQTLLPEVVRNAPKKAFNPPINSFIRVNFQEIKYFLGSVGALLHSYVSSEWIMDELEGFITKQKENSTLIWGLVVLEKWLQRQ